MINVRLLRHLAASGLTASEMAERMGIERTAVLRACSQYRVRRVDQRVAPDRERILRLIARGLSTPEVSRLTGSSRRAISDVARAHGVALNPPLTTEPIFDREQIVALTERGMTHAQVAVRVGCSVRTVDRVLKARGLTRPAARPYTPEEIARAEAMHADGCSVAEINRTLGRTMYNYFEGRTWTHAQVVEHAVASRQHRRRLAKAAARYAATGRAS